VLVLITIPFCVVTIIPPSLTVIRPATVPVLSVTFRLVIPFPALAVFLYLSIAVLLPYPFFVTVRMEIFDSCSFSDGSTSAPITKSSFC